MYEQTNSLTHSRVSRSVSSSNSQNYFPAQKPEERTTHHRHSNAYLSASTELDEESISSDLSSVQQRIQVLRHRQGQGRERTKGGTNINPAPSHSTAKCARLVTERRQYWQKLRVLMSWKQLQVAGSFHHMSLLKTAFRRLQQCCGGKGDHRIGRMVTQCGSRDSEDDRDVISCVSDLTCGPSDDDGKQESHHSHRAAVWRGAGHSRGVTTPRTAVLRRHQVKRSYQPGRGE